MSQGSTATLLSQKTFICSRVALVEVLLPTHLDARLSLMLKFLGATKYSALAASNHPTRQQQNLYCKSILQISKREITLYIYSMVLDVMWG